MDGFSYVMTLVAIIIGLGITHILSGVGQAIHRLRGHGAPIRLEAVYLLWVGTIFIWLISFWWFEYKFYDLQTEWTFGLYTFVVLYAVVLYLAAIVLVPSNMEEMHDSYEYFFSGRKWFFALMVFLVVVDNIDSVLKGVAWGLRPINLVVSFIFLTSFTVGAFATDRKIQFVSAAAAFTANFSYQFIGLTTLGNW